MEVKFLQAGCGDAIHIRYEGDDKLHHNILIDGGVENGISYENGIRKALVGILDRGEIIDLWIISHIDDDHIGGFLRFIEDRTLFRGFDLSRTIFWYNACNKDYLIRTKNSRRKSVNQGMRLRDFLSTYGLLNISINRDMAPLNFYGALITILSPDQEKLQRLYAKWNAEEVRLIKKRRAAKKASRPNDYKKLINQFDPASFEEDKSKENGSSIAFLLTYKESHILFSADSHPSVICEALSGKGYSETNRIKLSYFQVAHHGSKFNTSAALIRMVDCEHFIISADGYNKSNLPNKETMVRVIKNNTKKNTHFYITHQNKRTSGIFKVDKPIEGVAVHFPTLDSELTFSL